MVIHAGKRAHEAMENSYKEIAASFLLHVAVLSLVLWISYGGAHKERELLVVDFSIAAVGNPQEGGSRPGSVSNLKPSLVVDSPSKPVYEQRRPLNPEQKSAITDAPILDAPNPESRQQEPAVANEAVAGDAASSTMSESQSVPPHGQFADGANGQSEASGGGVPGGRGSGAGGTGTKDGPAHGYIKDNFNYILAHIGRNLRYPDHARRARLTGTARFAFVINQDGTIKNLKLEESSGHPELDEAAEKAIRRAAPFPIPPTPALLIVPIVFRLI